MPPFQPKDLSTVYLAAQFPKYFKVYKEFTGAIHKKGYVASMGTVKRFYIADAWRVLLDMLFVRTSPFIAA